MDIWSKELTCDYFSKWAVSKHLWYITQVAGYDHMTTFRHDISPNVVPSTKRYISPTQGRRRFRQDTSSCLSRDETEPSARGLVCAVVDERPVAADGDVQPVAGRLDRVHARRRSDLLADDEALPGRRGGADRRQRVVPGYVGSHVLVRARELERAGVWDVGADERHGRARRRGRGDEVRVRAGGDDVVARRGGLELEVPVRVLRQRAADWRPARVRPRPDEEELVRVRVARA